MTGDIAISKFNRRHWAVIKLTGKNVNSEWGSCHFLKTTGGIGEPPISGPYMEPSGVRGVGWYDYGVIRGEVWLYQAISGY